jgi:hypothetical protein
LQASRPAALRFPLIAAFNDLPVTIQPITIRVAFAFILLAAFSFFLPLLLSVGHGLLLGFSLITSVSNARGAGDPQGAHVPDSSPSIPRDTLELDLCLIT